MFINVYLGVSHLVFSGVCSSVSVHRMALLRQPSIIKYYFNNFGYKVQIPFAIQWKNRKVEKLHTQTYMDAEHCMEIEQYCKS